MEQTAQHIIMSKKLIITDDQVKNMVDDIITQMADDEFQPDYIVGITRGGLYPALLISQRLNVPMDTLLVSLRGDEQRTQSNCDLAEDAVGYPKGHNIKKILIVDDINDTGATLEWIQQDWEKAVPAPWVNIWHQNVRFASLVNNEASRMNTSYTSLRINKDVEDVWVIFPWERWWQ